QKADEPAGRERDQVRVRDQSECRQGARSRRAADAARPRRRGDRMSSRVVCVAANSLSPTIDGRLTQVAREERMSSDRREFMKLTAATAAVVGTARAATPAAAQTAA